MEKLLSMFGKHGIFVLLSTALILGIVQPASAAKNDDEVMTSPGTTTSTVTKALARQVAFVKTFSIEYPYQFEQETLNEKKEQQKKEKMRPE